MTGFRSSNHVNGRPLTLLKFPKELAAELLVTIGDSPSGQVVSGNLDLNAVSGENANVMFSHFAAQVTKNFMSIIQLDAEVPTLERFNRLALKQDGVVLLFRQTKFPSIAV